MLTLSLDTTADFGSIALLQEDETLEEVLLHAPQGFSHILFLQIEAILARHALELERIDLFAAASGPGSFTGVRVGLSAVKAFGEVCGRPVVPVSNLRALASYGSANLRATVIDARRGEVYAALYDDLLNAVIPEEVIGFPAFLAKLPRFELEWISSDFTPFQGAVTGNVVAAPRALASAIGRVALTLYKDNGGYPAEAADANYVRRSDAELLWKEY